MRISDWSSDVCSSDLVEIAVSVDLAVDDIGRALEEFIVGVARQFGAAEIAPVERERRIRPRHLPGRAQLMPPARRRLAAGRSEQPRSEEHTSELQSLMRISYAVFCLKKQIKAE